MAIKKTQEAKTGQGTKTAAPRKKKQPVSVEPAGVPSEEQIRTHAYYLSLERNGSSGDAMADWLRAEAEEKAREKRRG